MAADVVESFMCRHVVDCVLAAWHTCARVHAHG